MERGEELIERIIERIKVAGAGLNNPDSGVTLKVEATIHRDKLFGLLLPTPLARVVVSFLYNWR